jgi:hypothetical protein
MQEISVSYTAATGSMLFRLQLTHDPDCYYLIRAFDSPEKWLRFSMLFMQAMAGATAHAKTSLAA